MIYSAGAVVLHDRLAVLLLLGKAHLLHVGLTLVNVDQLLEGDTVVLRVLLVEVEGDRLVLVLIKKKVYVNFLKEFNPCVRASLHLPFFCTDISVNF